MSRPRVFAVENTLAKMAREPGGRTAEAAVKAAETRVEAQRGVSLVSLIEKSEALVNLAAAARQGAPDGLGPVYDLSNAIFGLASAFGLKALSDAAISLCDLADHFRASDEVNWPAIDVHVDGIRLLASLGEKAAVSGGDAILEGLRKVRAHAMPPN
ncbi:MAG: hypothetical protein DI570_23415 [Phenylobacterium zucineum]|nr:MAG: hypothetical protein DI570_23415 [Phenylobacterium zucineum]